MKFLSVNIIALVVLISCNSPEKEKIKTVPPPPSSIAMVKESIKGKSFQTTEVATISSFEMDKESPYTWFDKKKDTSAFARSYLEKSMQFRLQFTSDSTARMTDEGNTMIATCKFDDQSGEDEQPGIKLRITFEDKGETGMTGMAEPMVVTATYIVRGIDKGRLLLEAPREYNNRKVAVLMEAVK